MDLEHGTVYPLNQTTLIKTDGTTQELTPQGKIHQAEEYLKEIKDLIENLDMVHITDDLDLDTLSKARDYIKAFIQKQP